MATTRRSNITTAELLEALKNSGLPMGASQDMKNASMIAPDLVRNQIKTQFDPAREAAKKKYMDAISKIADMDARLGKLYASSESPLYMENPMDRERALIGAENVGYKESADAAEQIKQVEQSQADAEADALKVYDEFQTLTSSLEKGQKSLKSSSGKSSKKKTLADLARLESEEAEIEFNAYPLAFKRWFVNNVRGVEASDANKSGGIFFNPEDVASAYESYLEEQERKKASKKNSLEKLEEQVLKLVEAK